MHNYQLLTKDFVESYLKSNFTNFQIKSLKPHSFTIGSSFNSEPITPNLIDNSFFFGFLNLQICNYSIGTPDGFISLNYTSYLNGTPYLKTITRQVPTDTRIYENSNSLEFFKNPEIIDTTTTHHFYVSFIGYKIELI